MVADDAQGKADQDRREGRRSRPLCRVLDGGGGHSTRPVSRYFPDDRRTSAAANHIDGVARLVVTSSIETTGEVCLDDGKRRHFSKLDAALAGRSPVHSAAGVTGLAETRRSGQDWRRPVGHPANVGLDE